MRKEGSMWVDTKYNNRWSIHIYTKKEAVEASKTLTDCSGCTNCKDCINCRNCDDCVNCINCINCTSTAYCRACCNCSHCSDCMSCRHCTFCVMCTVCESCSNCRYCTSVKRSADCKMLEDASDNADQPEVYMTERVGSRSAITSFYRKDNGNIEVACGCFIGDFDEFVNAVDVTHDNKKSQYYKEYRKVIAKVKRLWSIR